MVASLLLVFLDLLSVVRRQPGSSSLFLQTEPDKYYFPPSVCLCVVLWRRAGKKPQNFEVARCQRRFLLKLTHLLCEQSQVFVLQQRKTPAPQGRSSRFSSCSTLSALHFTSIALFQVKLCSLLISAARSHPRGCGCSFGVRVCSGTEIYRGQRM